MAKVKVDLPNIIRKSELTEDHDESIAKVEVPPLGSFFNGATTEVSDEQVLLWEAQHDRTWPESGTLTVDHSEAQADRKKALDDIPEEEQKEIKAEVKEEQQALDMSEPAKKGGK